jgi:hypothetical protein
MNRNARVAHLIKGEPRPVTTPGQDAFAAGITPEDPPIRRRSYVRERWDSVLRALKRSPGEWFKLDDFSSNGAWRAYRTIKKAGYLPGCELRGTYIKDDEGRTRSVLYGRYVGEE